jgi:hypothetical protein
MNKVTLTAYCLLSCLLATYSQFTLACGENLPPSKLLFIENKGQLPEQVQYSVEMNVARLYLENNRLRYWLMSPDDVDAIHESHHSSLPLDYYVMDCHTFNVHFDNANPTPEIVADCAAPQYNNYYIGSDPSKWASHVQLYRQTQYQNLYDGIDMSLYGSDNGIKYDFIVAPNADPAQISLSYEHVNNISLINGDLHIATSVNNIIEQHPYAYQVANDGSIEPVACNFVLNGNAVSFNFPNGYDNNRQLVIDPFIVFASYTGSFTDNWGFTATYDNDGHLFAGGAVFFADGYPVTDGAFQQFFAGGEELSYGPTDIGITKFAPDGATLIYSTYVGGSLGNEIPQSLIVDIDGNLIIYGSTGSGDYPTTTNAYDTNFEGGTSVTINSISFNEGTDVIITKLNSDGTALVGSTYLGGIDNDGLLQPFSSLKHNYADEGRGEVNLDDQGFIYLATSTRSPDYPVTEGAYSITPLGQQEACVVKMSPDLTELVWGTFLSGSQDDAAYSVKIDDNGNVYVSGGTVSNNFPTTTGALHTTYMGGIADGYIAKLSNDGSTLLASTFMGTGGYDQVYFIELNRDQDFVYALGQSDGGYPVEGDVYNNPGSGVFIHKLNTDLDNTLFSTVIGNGNGFPNIAPTAFLVDVCDQIYISGWGGALSGAAGSGTFGMPITADAFQSTTDGSDFYFAILGGDGETLNYATFFGASSGTGEHVDGGTSRFDKNSMVYQAVCAGCGGSDLFPTTPGAWSETNNANNCNLGAIKFNFDVAPVTADFVYPPLSCGGGNITFTNISTNAEAYQWLVDGVDFGTTDDISTIFASGEHVITLIATKLGSCNGSDTLTRTLSVPEAPTVTAQNADICLFDTAIQLVGSPAGGTWSGSNIGASGLFNAAGLGVGTYTVNYTAGNECTASTTATVTIHALPEIELVAEPAFTGNGDEFAFSVVVNGDDASYSIGGDFGGTALGGIALELYGNGIGTTFLLTAIGDTWGCVSQLTVTAPLCNPSAGDMPDDLQIVCSDSNVSAATLGEILEPDQVLYYAIHTGNGTTAGTVLALNQSGTFGFADLNGASYNTEYYLSAIVSYPDGDGNPQLNDACTRIAAGMPVVFLSPITILVNEYCDWATTGTFYVTFNINGGLPDYDPTATYTVSGAYNGTFLPNQSETFSYEEGSGTTQYALSATDALSCMGNVSNTFICYKTDISLLSFEGNIQNEGNLLVWKTASETDNDYFTIERATSNNANFAAIGTVKGNGTTLATQQYDLLDRQAPIGTAYYRLRQTDFNGVSRVVGNVISLHRQSIANHSISIAPVPANTTAQISFTANEGIATVQLYDINGKLHINQALTVGQNGLAAYQANLNSLSAGVYLVRITDSKGIVSTSRLVKQ